MELPSAAPRKLATTGRVAPRAGARDLDGGVSRPGLLLRQGFRTRRDDQAAWIHPGNLAGPMGDVSNAIDGRTLLVLGTVPNARRSVGMVCGVLSCPSPQSSGALVLLVVHGVHTAAHRVSGRPWRRLPVCAFAGMGNLRCGRLPRNLEFAGARAGGRSRVT